MDKQNLFEVIEYLKKEQTKGQHTKFLSAIEELQDVYIEIMFEDHCDDNQDMIKESYQDRLLESGRYEGQVLSEVSDGRSEFCRQDFCELVNIGPSMTTDEQYQKIALFFNMI